MADTEAPNPANTESGEADSPLNKARLSVVDEIAAKREAEVDQEAGVQRESEQEQETAPEPTQEEKIAAVLADDDAYVPQDMLSRRVKLKIDGQETETTLEQLVRDAQKSAVASQRLQEANEILRAAEQIRSQAARTPDTIPPSPVQDPSPETVAKVKAALQSVFNGDEDAAAQQLASMFVTPAPVQQSPTIDLDQVAEAATRKLDERSALKKFFGTYQKISEHPYVQGRADQFFNHFASEGHDFETSLMKAGEALYKELGWELKTAEPASSTTTPRSQSLAARKAVLDTPTSRSVSAATNASLPESSEEDRSSVIAEMAARRNPTLGQLQKSGR